MVLSILKKMVGYDLVSELDKHEQRINDLFKAENSAMDIQDGLAWTQKQLENQIQKNEQTALELEKYNPAMPLVKSYGGTFKDPRWKAFSPEERAIIRTALKAISETKQQ